MNKQGPHKRQVSKSLDYLLSIPVVRANEFFENDNQQTEQKKNRNKTKDKSIFNDDREYRFCKAVIDYALKPSSDYPKLLRMSTTTALRIRQKLVAKKYIRKRTLDTSGRGRSKILLEPTSEGIAAVNNYQSLVDEP